MKRAQEVQKGIVESHQRTVTLGDCGQHIVVNELRRCSPKEPEGIEQRPVEGLLPLGMGELEIEHPAVALDHGQNVEFA